MGLRWRLGVVAALVAWCAAMPAARAADPAVELAAATTVPLEVAIKRGVPGLLAEIRLRNTAKDPAGARLVRPGPTLVRDTDGLTRPASWTRLDGGPRDTIAPGGELVLQLAAELPEPGVYEVWIETFAAPEPNAAPQPDRRVRVLVTRESTAIPSDLLIEPKPMHQARWPWTRKARTTLIEMANATGKPLEFQTPSLLGVGLKSGDAATLAASGRMPVLDNGSCASPLAPGARCALRLTLGGGWAPGQYAVELGVAGVGGGFSARTVPVWVRLPLWAPILVTAIGVAAGSLVQAWRAGGRRAVTGLIDLGLLRRRVTSIVEASPGLDLGGLTGPILDTVAALEARARSGTDAASDIAALSVRVSRLAGFASIERAFRKLPPEARAMLAAAHTRFAQQASAAASGQAQDGLDALAATMADLVNDWPDLAVVRATAAPLLASLARLRAMEGPGRAVAEAGQGALQAALASSVLPVAADAAGTAVADRLPPLQAAIEAAKLAVGSAVRAHAGALAQELETQLANTSLSATERAALEQAQAGLSAGGDDMAAIRGLEQAVQALGRKGAVRSGVEALSLQGGATPMPADLDLPTAIAFDLTATRTPRSLERQRKYLEWATNLIVLAALSLSGAVLVGGNASWGSPLDVIGLLLAGFGSRVVIDSLSLQPAPAAH